MCCIKLLVVFRKPPSPKIFVEYVLDLYIFYCIVVLEYFVHFIALNVHLLLRIGVGCGLWWSMHVGCGPGMGKVGTLLKYYL
jgi:hypothetical protein